MSVPLVKGECKGKINFLFNKFAHNIIDIFFCKTGHHENKDLCAEDAKIKSFLNIHRKPFFNQE